MSIPLSSYQDLIDLSPAKTGMTIMMIDQSQSSEDVSLQWLYREYKQQQADPRFRMPSIQPSQKSQLIRQLLTLRDPSIGLPPAPFLAAIDKHISRLSEVSPTPLVQAASLQSISESLFPTVPKGELPPTLSKMAIFRGDITRLAGDALAIVNPANTLMLGCFQPTHLCADNVIHAAAGPRLRDDCFTIMSSQDLDEAKVGEPIITKAWSLPSTFVLHVAGPQLSRGTPPTSEDRRLLARAYESSLDLAQEVGGIDTVAFPCISTGLFAFPAAEAASIAFNTVSNWIATHTTVDIKVIFVLFSESDSTTYSTTLATRFPSLPAPLAIPRADPIPPRVRQWAKEADSVIIHAGAGLSADAVRADLGLGLNYGSEELFKKLHPGLLKSTQMTKLYHSIGYPFESESIKWAYILRHGRIVTNWGPTPLYTSLLDFASSKFSYTILSSNADNLFLQSGFDPNRLWTPQGTYTRFQCLEPCTPSSYFDSKPWFDKAWGVIDPEVMEIPEGREDLIPHCEKCGGDVFLQVRGGDWFLETPQEGQRERYWQQVEEAIQAAEMKGKKVLVLEIGAGFNTPSVVRWPSEDLVREFGETVKLVRVNLANPEVPLDLSTDQAAGVKMGAAEFLDSLK